MAKKLNDPSKRSKNHGSKQRCLGRLINSEQDLLQKEILNT